MTGRDSLSRTLKLELDSGRAASIEDAEVLAGRYVLQLGVGPDVGSSVSRQAMLLTIVNAACRAFAGGVHVAGDLDWPLATPWFYGWGAIDAVTALGATTAAEVTCGPPTIILGTPPSVPAEAVTIFPTWNGWSAGVVASASARLSEAVEHPLAGVAAGAIAVSEAFQHVRGSVVAGHREVGISLWNPSIPWRSDSASGPPLRYLPSQLWILGLGHLGQAYAWSIGFLPYADRSKVTLWLQDFDVVVSANRSTGLLVSGATEVGVLKTRLAAGRLEELGFRTRLVERRFDDASQLSAGEPTWAVAGFDAPEPRRHLDLFDFAVDVGLGADYDDYLGVHVHTFPAAGSPGEVFSSSGRLAVGPPPVWASAVTDDPCGVLQLAGVSVGAAFVGAFASSLAIGELLRVLAGQPATAVASCRLDSLVHFEAVTEDIRVINPGFEFAT